MKKKILFITLSILTLLYLQFGFAPTLNSVITTSNPQGYDATLTITTNKLIILNRNRHAESLIKRIVENDFANMQLSYDEFGYPNELQVTVYTNIITKALNLPAFTFRYEQETPYLYNIKDNPEKFEIILDTK